MATLADLLLASDAMRRKATVTPGRPMQPAANQGLAAAFGAGNDAQTNLSDPAGQRFNIGQLYGVHPGSGGYTYLGNDQWRGAQGRVKYGPAGPPQGNARRMPNERFALPPGLVF